MAGRGCARQGEVWLGGAMRGQTRYGLVGPGVVWLGKEPPLHSSDQLQGKTWRGSVWLGMARYGKARRGGA